MKKKKAWAIIRVGKIDIISHGEEEIDTLAILTTKKMALECNKNHCDNDAKIVRVEIIPTN